MKQFPITNADYSSEFPNYYCSYCIPRFEWGKKIYFLIKEELRAVVPLAVCIAKNGGDNEIHPYLLCRMAGYDKNRIVRLGFLYDSKPKKLECGVKAYKTQDDYFSALEGNDTEMRIPFVSLDWCLELNGYKIGSDSNSKHCAMAWGFDESTVKPVLDKTRIKELWLDDEGPHVELTYKYAYNSSTILYPTAKESLIAHTAKVVDFDEDVVETKPPVKRLDDDSKLICESIQEVTLVAWDMIYGENNQYDLDSREVLELCRTWGEEFESWWINHDEVWISEHDYIAEVESFAEKKATEYIESLK